MRESNHKVLWVYIHKLLRNKVGGAVWAQEMGRTQGRGVVVGCTARCALWGGVLWFAALAGCVGDTTPPDAGATASIELLSRTPQDFDGTSATIRGEYVETLLQGGADCEPFPFDGERMIREDSYRPYPASWSLQEGSLVLGVVVRGDDGQTQITARPTQTKGDVMTLRGVLHHAFVPDPCSDAVGYHSIYLEISAREAGLEGAVPPPPPGG